jgi:hypothetical protein
VWGPERVGRGQWGTLSRQSCILKMLRGSVDTEPIRGASLSESQRQGPFAKIPV